MIAATDLPVSERQLHRILKRASVGLARLGSFVGHGSGEIMIGFSTATRVRYDEQEICTREVIPEGQIDRAFRAIAECAEEAVLDSMVCAHEMTGYQDHHVFGLSDWLDKEEIAQLLK